MVLMKVEGVTKYFGGLPALSEVDFEVHQGEILGLIGPNGAGKTTLYNVVSGLYQPTKGRIVYKGQDITRLPSHEVARRGIVRTFQMAELFKGMTVFENTMVAHHLHSREGIWGGLFNTATARRDRAEIEQSVMEILEFMQLASVKDELAKNLPHGYQRALGVAIGLAARPELLLLDEPVTGMNPTEATTFMDILRRVRDERRITLMLVEHNMRTVVGICDRILVLSFGKKIAEGLPREITKNKNVIEAYLGVKEIAA